MSIPGVPYIYVIFHEGFVIKAMSVFTINKGSEYKIEVIDTDGNMQIFDADSVKEIYLRRE